MLIFNILLNLAGKKLVENLLESSRENSHQFSLLLQKISDILPKEERLIIIIDGCDRIDLSQQTRGSNIFYLPRYLPQKVYFILTRRPFLSDKSGLLIETPAQVFNLEDYPQENNADIQEYIKNFHAKVPPFLSKSRGNYTNFMYVKSVLENKDIINDNLPESLQNYYQNHWQKMNIDINEKESLKLKILKYFSNNAKSYFRRKYC